MLNQCTKVVWKKPTACSLSLSCKCSFIIRDQEKKTILCFPSLFVNALFNPEFLACNKESEANIADPEQTLPNKKNLPHVPYLSLISFECIIWREKPTAYSSSLSCKCCVWTYILRRPKKGPRQHCTPTSKTIKYGIWSEITMFALNIEIFKKNKYNRNKPAPYLL